MTEALRYANIAYYISIIKTELMDIGEAFRRDGDTCTALLAKDASVAVYDVLARLELLHKRAAVDKLAAQAAVVAILRPDETVEAFTERGDELGD